MCLVYAKITTLIVLLLLSCSLPHGNLFSLYWLTCALHPSSLSEWRSTCSRSSRTASNLFDILRVSSSKLEWTVGGASMPLQNYRQMYWPGHFCSLHLLSSSLSPLQSLPPGPGGGLLQLRVLFWVPPPHVLLQLLQRVQSPQLPSTTKNVQYVNFLWTPEQWYSEQWLQAVTRLSSNDLFYITTWFSFFSKEQFFYFPTLPGLGHEQWSWGKSTTLVPSNFTSSCSSNCKIHCYING